MKRVLALPFVILLAVGCASDPDQPAPAGTPDDIAVGDTANEADVVAPEPDVEQPVDLPPIPDAEPGGCQPGTMEVEVDGPPNGCVVPLPSPEAVATAWPLSVTTPELYGPQVLPMVEDADDCLGRGWYLPEPWAPTSVALCPAACNKVVPGNVAISWSCATKPHFEAPQPPDEDVDQPDATDPDTDSPSECPTGGIQGLVCSPGKQIWAANAKVSVTADCNGQQITVSTTSDETGYYFLDGIPTGVQTVEVTGASATVSYPALIQEGHVTDTSTFARKQCYTLLAPDACYNGKLEYTIVKSTADKLIDIIWAVDTSGSMSEESAAVQANLNAFATYINNAEVDYRVVLISDDSICVPSPLAGPNCGDSERFRHIDSEVYSTDALEKIISNYSKFASFLRPHAQTHFVVVSDDNSSKSAKWFTDQAYFKDNFSAPFVFHSVVGAGPDPNGCPTAADEGTVYLELSNKTGGGVYPICSTDWSGVYNSLADVVVQAVCGFPITHYTALSNADTVYLKHSLDGQEASLPQVATAEDCDGPGFYALSEPPLVVLCPASCETLLEGKLKLQWVCPE